MGIDEPRPATLEELLRKALDLVEELQTRALLIGGLAVGVVGEARVTQDVDLILALPLSRLGTLVKRARATGFAIAPASLKEAKLTGAVRLRWRGLHADIIFASTDFEESVFRRRVTVTLAGRAVSVPSPEDLILLKLVPGREKDLLDAKSILLRHRRHLDRSYLERWAQRLSDEAEDLRMWQTLKRLLAEQDHADG